ncbi:hypothetical protein [Maioricimonas rarisocia]|nr:hypothetical protein [Maioricimonas rarisocia]
MSVGSGTPANLQEQTEAPNYHLEHPTSAIAARQKSVRILVSLVPERVNHQTARGCSAAGRYSPRSDERGSLKYALDDSIGQSSSVPGETDSEMSETAAKLLAMFETLPEEEQHELLVVLMQRSGQFPATVLTDVALTGLADELFQQLDAGETDGSDTEAG